jgi:hypothetical protein
MSETLWTKLAAIKFLRSKPRGTGTTYRVGGRRKAPDLHIWGRA